MWLQDGRRFQYDFVVETDLRLGSGESAYLAFEGDASGCKWFVPAYQISQGTIVWGPPDGCATRPG